MFYCVHEEHQLHFFGGVHIVVIKILSTTPNEITNLLRALNRASLNDLLNGNNAKCGLHFQNRADLRLPISLRHSAVSVPDLPCLNVPDILPMNIFKLYKFSRLTYSLKTFFTRKACKTLWLVFSALFQCLPLRFQDGIRKVKI